MSQAQAQLVQGWRNEEINKIYDIAANMDGYYFEDAVVPSRQKNYHREYYYKRMLTGKEAHRERVRESMKAETGRNNRVTTMNAIQRMKSGRGPHPQAKFLTAEIFDKCRAKLVEAGKLADNATSVTGADYVHWITHTLPEYEKGQPRFGGKKYAN